MTNHELHWLAFRYVAGEMTPTEEEAFELWLADDQEAREAVEQAVELNEAIRRVATEPVPARLQCVPAIARRPAAWAALAATLLLTLGLHWLISSNSQKPIPTGNGNIDSQDSRTGAEMARAWVEVRDREPLVSDTPESQPLTESDLGMEPVTDPEIRVPQWMLTAFSAPTKRD